MRVGKNAGLCTTQPCCSTRQVPVKVRTLLYQMRKENPHREISIRRVADPDLVTAFVDGTGYELDTGAEVAF